MNYHSTVSEVIRQHKPNEMIVANHLYQESLKSVPESTYYKILERMVKDKTLTRLARGVYCLPKITRFGTIPKNQQEIIRYYTGETGTDGIVVGYALYNRYGLTTQITKSIKIYSNRLTSGRKTFGDIQVWRVSLVFREPERDAIEALEILQHYNEIEESQIIAFRNFLAHAAKQYHDTATQTVLQHIRYKKRTIAFFAEVLDYFHVNHSLRQYLSSLSTYQIPTMEEIYEPAS